MIKTLKSVKHRLYAFVAHLKYVMIAVAYLIPSFIAPFMSTQTASAAFFSDSPISSYPTVGSSQTIYASEEASDGSLYVGGLFSTIGGVTRNNLALILEDGTVDSSFNPDIDGEVRSLKLDEASSTLYIGGEFETVNGSTSRDNIAALDSLTGIAKPLDVATSDAVYALDLDADTDTLYVGGGFADTYDEFTTAINAVAIDSSNNRYLLNSDENNIVKLDENNDFVTQWGSAGTGDGEFDYPTDIAIDSSDNVYVTDENNSRIQKFSSDGTYITQWGSAGVGNGEFSEISSISIDSANNVYVADPDNVRIQKFSSTGTYITQWGSAGTGDGEFSDLRSVAADQFGNVYAMEGLLGNNRIQKFDDDGLFSIKWDLPLENNYDITTNADGKIYLATDYAIITSYSPLGVELESWQNSDGSLNTMTLASNGTSVFVTAVDYNFTEQFSTQVGQEGDLLGTIFGAKERQDLVAFNTSNGKVTNFNAKIETCSGGGTVHSLDLDSANNTLYIGGHISSVQDEPRNGLAKVDPITGALDEDFDPDISWSDGTSGVCSEVYDIELHDNKIYAAGNFDEVNGGDVERNNFAAFETEEGEVDEDFNPNVSGTIYAIAYDGSGVIYAGGNFTKANSHINQSGIASFRITDGKVTLFSPDIQTPDSVYSLSIASNGSKLFAGGSFDQVGGMQQRGLAVFAQTECTYVNFTAPSPSEGTTVPLHSQTIGALKNDGHFLRNYSPGSMAVDGSGNVYVVDQEQETGSGVSQILKYSSSGVFISKFGSFGSGDGQFNYPQGVAVGTDGSVYVGDNGNNRIQKFDSNGTYISQWGTAGSGDGEFDYLTGITIDSNNNIYVADSSNNRIQKFDSSGNYIAQWGNAGSGDGQFNFPNYLAVDSNDNIIVSDAYNYRTQTFSDAGSYLSQISIGSSAYSIDTNSSDMLFVAHGGGLSIYDSSGSLVQTLGLAELGNDWVESVVVDKTNGNLFVGDTANARVRKLSASYVYILQWGEPAYDEDNQLFQPRSGLNAVGSDGKIYVQVNSGAAPEIKIYAPNGDFLQSWAGPEYYGGGLAVDDDGNVYTTYWGSVRKFDQTGAMVGEIFVNTNGNLNNPEDIVIDSENGYMYVADSGNSRVVKISLDGTTGPMEYGITGVQGLALSPNGESLYVLNTNVKEYATNNLDLLGQWGATGDEDGEFDTPTGIDTDSVGNIYIADSVNIRIQKYTSEGDYLSQWGELGNDNGEFAYYEDNPQFGVNVDDLDNVWVADTYSNRLQKFAYVQNSPDYDNDGIPDSEELESINDGDGNNDCDLDAEQQNVSSLMNDQIGGYITIVGPSGSQFISSATQTAPNTKDKYPFGLFSFVLDGVTVGGQIEINAFVESDEDPANLIVRKYFPSTQTYLNIPGATVVRENINGKEVLHLTYRITDGSIFDLDGVANGSISDPAGMAVKGESTTSPSTASQLLQKTGSNVFVRLAVSFGVITSVYLLSKKRNKLYVYRGSK